MNYTPYRTATAYKAYYASIGITPSLNEQVQIDILGTLENIYDQGGCADMTQINGVTSGQTFQSDQLIGKNPNTLMVHYDGFLKNGLSSASPDYSFDGATGTITFLFTVTNGIVLLIEYSA